MIAPVGQYAFGLLPAGIDVRGAARRVTPVAGARDGVWVRLHRVTNTSALWLIWWASGLCNGISIM